MLLDIMGLIGRYESHMGLYMLQYMVPRRLLTVYGTKAASDYVSKVYRFENRYQQLAKKKWRVNLTKHHSPFKKKGHPNLLNDNLLRKVKDVMVEIRATGAFVSRRLVIAIGEG